VSEDIKTNEYSGPVRRCTGCGNHFPKSDLLRIVNVDGKAALDALQTAQSRGTYVCKNEKCFARAQKNGRISGAIKCPVDADVLTTDVMKAIRGE